MTTSAERLYGLPGPVQDLLSRLIDHVMGMSASEKDVTRILLGDYAMGLVEADEEADGDLLMPAEVVSICGRLVALADELAQPTEVGA